MLKINIEKIIETIEPVIVGEGFQLVEVEFKNEREGCVLRLYIDKDGGVAVNDCATISHEVGNILDVEDIIHIAYRLEVSSPGLNRPLRKKEHFQKAIGEEIAVKAKLPIDNSKNFKGKLIKAQDAQITILQDGAKEVTIDLDNILKANVVYKF